ncbi:Ead/Ea22-like family protein [Enterobacter intestinihominis]
MTANKPMTGEQLDELMTIAVNMQRDSEKVSDRPAAMFAYAVQVVVLELRKNRNEAAALAAENAQMLRLLTDISENHDEYVNQDEYLYAGIPMDYVSEINSYVSRDVEAENPFKATDAFMAEVRAQGVEMFAAHKRERQQALRSRSMRMSEEAAGMAADAENFADELRKGVQS